MELLFNKLSNPENYKKPINFEKKNKELILKFLKKITLIRLVEKKIAHHRKLGDIGGPVHLGIGQEAIAVGISENLNLKDKVFGAHRSHTHLLALGSDFYKLFAEVLGKSTGHSNGLGGSMHLIDKSVGFFGSTPIVAGTVPLAVGAAMASRLKNDRSISVAYLGDGACEEGVVHESLNLAKLNNEPILFVVENNFFSSHLHISLRQPKSFLSRFAEANGIAYKMLDGNNVFEIFENSKDLIKNIRDGSGPGFIEAITYRWLGHVDWREDIDVGVNRSSEDLRLWKERDPINRILLSLYEKDFLTPEKYDQITLKINEDINNAWSKAENDPFPKRIDLNANVYSK